MAFARFVVLLSIVVFFAKPASAADPRPPQLQISFLAEPAPIVQYGSTKLVYEMVVTNFSKRSYVFDTIETKAGALQFSFSGTALAAMMAHLGPWDPVAGPASDRTQPTARRSSSPTAAPGWRSATPSTGCKFKKSTARIRRGRAPRTRTKAISVTVSRSTASPPAR